MLKLIKTIYIVVGAGVSETVAFMLEVVAASINVVMPALDLAALYRFPQIWELFRFLLPKHVQIVVWKPTFWELGISRNTMDCVTNCVTRPRSRN